MVNLVLAVFVVVLQHCFLLNFSVGSESPEGKRDVPSTIPWEELDKMLDNGFLDVKRTLKNVNQKLVKTHTKDFSMRSDFKDNLVQVQALYDAWDNHLYKDTDITKALLLKACENYPMLDVTEFVIGEITRKNVIQTLGADLDNMDPNGEFLIWSKLATLTFLMASLLGDECLDILYQNDPGFSQIRTFYRDNSKHDFQMIIIILKQVDKSTEIEPKDQYNTDWRIDLPNAAAGVYRILNGTEYGVSDKEVVDSIYTFLAHEYSWRSWLIISYWPGPKEHFVTTCKSSPIQAKSGLTKIILASPDYTASKDFEVTYDECANEYWLEPRYCGVRCTCRQFLEQFKNCTRGISYSGIFCFERPNNLRFKEAGLGMKGFQGFKHYAVTLSKVEDGYYTTDISRREEFPTTKDIFVTVWRCGDIEQLK